MNKILVLGLCLLPGFSIAQEQAYTVKGKIRNWKGADTVVLHYSVDNQLRSDTAIARNGVFEFKGTLSQPTLTYISHQRPTDPHTVRDASKFYLEPGIVQLEAADSLKYMKVTKGTENKFFQEQEEALKPYYNTLTALRMQGMKMTEAERKSEQAKALNEQYKAAIDSVIQTRIRFINTHPDAFLSAEALNFIAGSRIDYKLVQPLYAKLSPRIKATPLGKNLAERIEKARKTMTGVVMPSFTSLDTARQPVNLDDVVHRAKVTLVDFWASWCAPCRAENPNVVKAFNAFHDKGFDIISVSLDDNAERWKAAIIKDGMPWHHVSGLKKWQEPVAVFFGIEGIPDNFLLDEKGTVVARGLRGEELYKKIASMVQ